MIGIDATDAVLASAKTGQGGGGCLQKGVASVEARRRAAAPGHIAPEDITVVRPQARMLRHDWVNGGYVGYTWSREARRFAGDRLRSAPAS